MSNIDGYGVAYPTRYVDKELLVTLDEPRELTPIQKFWDGSSAFRDFGPHPVPADTPEPEDEAEEVEEVLTPAPKAESAQVSAPLPDSHPKTEPSASETPVPPVNESSDQTAAPESPDAAKASGKDSGSNEDVPPTQSSASPSPASSSPSSSSETSPGSNTPPASVKPPFVASPPAGQTTQA